MEVLVPSFSGFLLILVRVTSFFITMPIYSHRSLPAMHRIGIGVFLSWIMYYTMEIPVFEIDASYYLLIIKEALVGLLIGFIAYLMLSAIQIAGGFIDFQMGLAIANVIDPQTGVQSPLVGQYLYMFALLFLLATNGHHLLMDGIFYSYQFVPIDQYFIDFSREGLLEFVIMSFNQMFIIAFQMAIPVVGSLFIVDVALGILARTMPQLNVFVVGLPIKLFVSFVVLLIVMGVTMTVVGQLFEYTLLTMRGLMDWMGGA
ncbi:flagellar type III secretion system protein FliR [Bacillus sp. AGMB 02131]|uniref:Flagellar biosynthetic protein FliR n=1 Tax=Peribacillus faecalis TaxID=2772559 RepID=A0A927CYG7_9BACI|nr:flagellar biosynthetic protein FliR [Peribacillus faecalis]MBD3109429.1 flagellar type III secretion system protein FliR [Peribacillus faecalis]